MGVCLESAEIDRLVLHLSFLREQAAQVLGDLFSFGAKGVRVGGGLIVWSGPLGVGQESTHRVRGMNPCFNGVCGCFCEVASVISLPGEPEEPLCALRMDVGLTVVTAAV